MNNKSPVLAPRFVTAEQPQLRRLISCYNIKTSLQGLWEPVTSPLQGFTRLPLGDFGLLAEQSPAANQETLAAFPLLSRLRGLR